MRFTQTPNQMVADADSLGVKRQGHTAGSSISSNSEVTICRCSDYSSQYSFIPFAATNPLPLHMSNDFHINEVYTYLSTYFLPPHLFYKPQQVAVSVRLTPKIAISTHIFKIPNVLAYIHIKRFWWNCLAFIGAVLNKHELNGTILKMHYD